MIGGSNPSSPAKKSDLCVRLFFGEWYNYFIMIYGNNQVLQNGDKIPFARQKEYIMVNNALGRGSFGKTVLIEDPVLKEQFVAKKYEPVQGVDAKKFYQSFLREIKLLYKLNHPNIVRIYNYYTYESYQTGYIIMEYILGKTIDEYIICFEQQDRVRVLEKIFTQLINAFDYIESNNIIHRDIRCSNIMVDNEGVVKVIDFGIGKINSKCCDEVDSLGSIINRPTIKPNESQDHQYTIKTDQYYLGMLLSDLLQSTVDNEQPGMFKYIDIVNKMINTDPCGRYESFNEIKLKIANDDFDDIGFSDQEKHIYQLFSEQLLGLIDKFDEPPEFLEDQQVIIDKLKKVLNENIFECNVINACDIVGAFIKTRFQVYAGVVFKRADLERFQQWFINMNERRQAIILMNLRNKLSTIIVVDPFLDIPF